MNVENLFRIIHNLDVREPLRKYHPQHSMISIDKNGDIVAVETFKHRPTRDEQDDFFSKYKKTAIFFANPDIYPTVNELKEKIKSCQEALRNRDITRKYTGKGLVGDTYFGGRRKKT
jgi:hypothetical protein